MTFALADYLQALEMDPTNLVIHERISEIHAYRANVLFENKRFEVKIFNAFRFSALTSFAVMLYCMIQCTCDVHYLYLV